jgi:hypothetical protein
LFDRKWLIVLKILVSSEYFGHTDGIGLSENDDCKAQEEREGNGELHNDW